MNRVDSEMIVYGDKLVLLGGDGIAFGPAHAGRVRICPVQVRVQV